MDTRFLGRSGLQVPVLCLGTMTLGGGDVFKHMGNVQVDEARRLVDVCLEGGLNFFDTADVYSQGASEEVLGAGIGREHRDQVLIATKAFGRMGPGVHDTGLSRQHLVSACEASLRRLNTDYIDLYQVHAFDTLVPIEETLRALDDLVRAGKVRYVGCSNFSGWHLAKSLGISQHEGLVRYCSQQIYYSLLHRDTENELIPAGLDLGVGILVYSPLSFGLLAGRYRRDTPKPTDTRLANLDAPGSVDWERLYRTIDVLDTIAKERGKTVAQVAINWLLRRPAVASVIIGVRNEAQLKDNLGAVGWSLDEEEVRRLENASDLPEAYPYWHQHKYALDRNPLVARTYVA
jgi:aryl-alcohol dehydrogenase-like predicted oxidoreductase